MYRGADLFIGSIFVCRAIMGCTRGMLGNGFQSIESAPCQIAIAVVRCRPSNKLGLAARLVDPRAHTTLIGTCTIFVSGG